MSIKVSQAFERTSAQPIDASVALTKAQMLAVNDNLMPTYYFTICQDDGKLYLYDKNATASLTTGKFTEFSGGGGGHTIIDTDGNVMAPEDNLQFTGLDVQDDSTSNTTNVESFGLSADSIDDVVSGAIRSNFIPSTFNYSTNEQVVGKWIDGKPIYQKTYSFSNVAINANTEFTMAPYDSSIDKIICGFLNTPYKDTINPVYITNNSTTGIVSYVALPSKTTGSLWSHCNSFTIQYTKTTD